MRAGYLYVAGFLACAVGANVATDRLGLVELPATGLMVTAGTFVAAGAFVLRDGVHEAFGRWATVALIIAGGLLTAVFAPALAVASSLAFLVSELVDLVVYQRVRARGVALAVLLSSVVAAPVDTVLFLRLAGFDVTREAVLGQWIVKTALAGMAAGCIAVLDRLEAQRSRTALRGGDDRAAADAGESVQPRGSGGVGDG